MRFQRCPRPLPERKPAKGLPVRPGRPRGWPQHLIPWGYSGWITVGCFGRLVFWVDHFNEIRASRQKATGHAAKEYSTERNTQ